MSHKKDDLILAAIMLADALRNQREMMSAFCEECPKDEIDERLDHFYKMLERLNK